MKNLIVATLFALLGLPALAVSPSDAEVALFCPRMRAATAVETEGGGWKVTGIGMQIKGNNPEITRSGVWEIERIQVAVTCGIRPWKEGMTHFMSVDQIGGTMRLGQSSPIVKDKYGWWPSTSVVLPLAYINFE